MPMFTFLKNHPFAVEAFFESSTVLTFAVPKEELISLIPKHLTLDTFEDKWAFVAVALVQTKGLRPKGFPAFMGNDFFLVGYRIFVRYTNLAGKRLRGLYILKSETDKKKMEYLGNVFTHYKYTTADFQTKQEGNTIQISDSKSGFLIKLDHSAETVNLPTNSPFADWKEARRFAGPLPFTFTYKAEKNEMLIIEGVRENWTPKPIKIENYHIPFLDSLSLKEIYLANAFVIENIPYFWKKGKIEKLN